MTPRLVPDSTRSRLVGFVAVLVVAFGSSFAVGRAVGSDPAPARPAHETPTTVAPGVHDMEGMGS